MVGMSWTAEKPTEHGYYWMKLSGQHVPEVVLVTFGKLHSPYLFRMVYRLMDSAIPLDSDYLAQATWCGPLSAP